MSLRDELHLLAPRLRRFSRALVAGCAGPNESADDLVQTALFRTLKAGTPGRLADLSLHLYGLITELHREALHNADICASAALEHRGGQAGGARAADVPQQHSLDRLSRSLAGLKLEEREALLLVVLERFSYAQAARILKVSRPILISRLARARAGLGERLCATSPSPSTKSRQSHLRLVK